LKSEWTISATRALARPILNTDRRRITLRPAPAGPPRPRASAGPEDSPSVVRRQENVRPGCGSRGDRESARFSDGS
jgi:hypothetical protein